MMPMNPGFRKLILRYNPKLSVEDLNRYDNLLALRLELAHERSMVPATVAPSPDQQYEPAPEPSQSVQKKNLPMREHGELPDAAAQVAFPIRDDIDLLLKRTTVEADNILAPYRNIIAALQKLWIARRHVAHQQGGLLQIPTTTHGFAGLVRTQLNYRKVQVQTFPTLTINYFKNFTLKKIATALLFVVLIYAGWYALHFSDLGKQPPRQKEPIELPQE